MRMTVLVQMRRREEVGDKHGSQDMIQSGRKSTHELYMWKVRVCTVSGVRNTMLLHVTRPCVSFQKDKIKSHSSTCAHKEAAQHQLQADAEESARSGGIVVLY